MQEVINELRNEGYRLIREKDIVYALPRRYFDTYESLMTILAEIIPIAWSEFTNRVYSCLPYTQEDYLCADENL
jgi:hypothetical protein